MLASSILNCGLAGHASYTDSSPCGLSCLVPYVALGIVATGLAWFLWGVSHKQSEEAARKKKEKSRAIKKARRKEKSINKTKERIPNSRVIEVKTKWLKRDAKHTDAYLVQKYGNKFAYPRGFESFVDDWPESGMM